jgi:hypothetical protein
MQWDVVWQLCKPLRGNFPMMIGEGPRHRHRRGVRGVVYACGGPSHTAVVVPIGVTTLLGLRNPPRSWNSTVGPSLPDFTIAPCVDSLLCYRSIRRPKSILQDSPEV